MSSATLPPLPRAGRSFARGPAPRTRTRRSAAAATAAAVVLGVLSGGAATAAAKVAPPDVPSKIAVEAGHKPYLVGHATGVQSYPCDGATWGPATPRAVLTKDDGKVFITHYGGPTWEANDGSTVIGSRVDGVTVDPDAIPWLLLSAASTTTGPDGDKLTRTTFIQRLNTTGGKAPAASDCTPARAGERVEIPYTADYVFWRKD